MTFNHVKFHYRTGEIVAEGDHVFTGNGDYGIVKKVIAPGTSDAIDFQCPQGGILIEEDWEGEKGLILETPPDGESWEDLDFVSRGPGGLSERNY